MLIECNNCQKRYNIPMKKLRHSVKELYCFLLDCKEKIEIIPENIGNQETEIPAEDQSSSGLSTGENLRKEILSSIKDLLPMPQVVQKAREVTV